MSCTYTKISLTRNETSVFFFLVCLGLQVWLKGWLMSVYALIVKLNDWSATECCCTDVMKLRTFFFFFFTSEILSRPETGQCGLLMYINELCSMVVFWSWFMIGLNAIRQISEAVDVCCSQMCGFVRSPDAPLWGEGVLTGPSATVNLLAWSKVF